MFDELRQQLEAALIGFLFEENTPDIRARATETVKQILIHKKYFDYSIVCDDTNNTPERINEHQFFCDVAICLEEGGDFYYIPIRLMPVYS